MSCRQIHHRHQLSRGVEFVSVCVNLLGNAASTCSFLEFCVPRGEINPCTSRLLCADASGTMQSPASPAIDDSAVDFGIFDSELNKEAAGYDDGVEEDDHPDHPFAVDVQICMEEEDEMDEENYDHLCDFAKFPPESDSDHWVPNDVDVIPHVFADKARQDMFNKLQKEIEVIVERLVEAEVRGNPTDLVDKAIAIFFGSGSSFYHIYQDIFPNDEYDNFAQFIGAYFLAASWNSTYNQCYNDPRMDASDFCDDQTYLDKWDAIEYHNKHTNGKRAWKKFQGAFNKTVTEKFSPTRQDMKVEATGDDDKLMYQVCVVASSIC